MTTVIIFGAFIVAWTSFLMYIAKEREKSLKKQITGYESLVSKKSKDIKTLQDKIYLLKNTIDEALDTLNQTKTGQGKDTLKAIMILGDTAKTWRIKDLANQMKRSYRKLTGLSCGG